MKRSRRVVLTMMGSAAVSALSTALAEGQDYCGPGLTLIPGPGGKPFCRATHGGFGGTLHHIHGHGGHGGPGHGGHGHGGG